MKIIIPPEHSLHNPPYEIWNGEQTPNQETPARLENILKTLKKLEHDIVSVSVKVPAITLSKIHSSKYIDFLRDFCITLSDTEYKYPSVFSMRSQSKDTYTYPLTRHGYYSFDMYTPLMKKTFEAALNSASCAYQVAEEILKAKYDVGFALCRPPGHHAEYDQMGGYCYINNAAVAAQHLSKYGTVAVLDVDFHHGNGTQHIFYNRKDVLTVSIHADPDWKFPHFSGYENEIGEGSGEGYNFNFVLSKGTGNLEYQKTLEKALKEIKEFRPRYLVVSFGADTHEDDPIGGFKLTTEYFEKMARSIAKLGKQTVIVQEGGYNTSLLGKNVASFLSGFEG